MNVQTQAIRTALQNAASIAGLMLSTEAITADIQDKRATPAWAEMGGGM